VNRLRRNNEESLDFLIRCAASYATWVKAGLAALTVWLLMASTGVFTCRSVMAAAAPPEVSKRAKPVKIPLLVLLLEYKDCKLVLKEEDWNKKIFSLPSKEEEDQRFDLFGPSGGSVNQYYNEVTCGRFQFEPVAENYGTPNDGVIKISLDVPHPLEAVPPMAEAVKRAMSDATRYMDFARYDRDKNKSLSQMELAIVVVSAGGYEDKTGSKNRCYYYSLNVGGLRRKGYVVVTERRDDLRSVYATLAKAAGEEPKYKNFIVSQGTLIHELGHAFGTPDLLNAGYLTAVGYGQKNASTAFFPGTKLEYKRNTPSHYGAYTMVKGGFVTPIVLTKTGVYVVSSAETGKYNVYKIPTKSPKEYFLIENWQPKGGDLAMGVKGKARPIGGIAIWHINEAFGKSNDKDKQMVAIEEASEGTLGYSSMKKNRSLLALDPFYPLPGNTEFSSDSTPNNRSYGGEPQPWKITGISASAKVMTFKFTTIGRNP
jgi:M6 family metalloprotease-like protein